MAVFRSVLEFSLLFFVIVIYQIKTILVGENILEEGYMEIYAKLFADKSVITVDKNKFIGVEGETFQNLVNNSIDKGSKSISIDLSKVNYISSSGVELLMHAYRSCSKNNVKFNVEGANKLVKDVLSSLKLSKIFNIS